MSVLTKGKAMQGKLFSSQNTGRNTEENGIVNKSTVSRTNPPVLVFPFMNTGHARQSYIYIHITCTTCAIKIQGWNFQPKIETTSNSD